MSAAVRVPMTVMRMQLVRMTGMGLTLVHVTVATGEMAQYVKVL